MKRLSMTDTLADAQRALGRFPLVLLCATVAAITAIYSIDHSSTDGPANRILMTAILGIPFILTLALALEKTILSVWQGWLVRLAGVITVALYFFVLPQEIPVSHFIRFTILFIGAHFLVAVAPFLKRRSDQALWQFNKTMLLRLISSVMFTFVMYAGLCLALAALDQLLGVPLLDDIYWKLFLILGFIFHTWFFLGGIPASPMSLADDKDFPRPLRVFAQHILSTLVVVYLAIMMAYLGKVIFTGVWPSGWIGWLVSGVAVTGLLSVVLLSPLQGKPENPWIGIYFRIFHILMIPSVVMLVLAVGKRINQYGLTELRYVLLILSAWMMVMLVVGLLSRRINLRLIPLSLGLLALGISLGPWGVVSMSLSNQMDRLQETLEDAGLFANGVLVSNQKIDSKVVDRSELTSSFEYLMSQYGGSVLDSWFTPEMHETLYPEALDSSSNSRNNWALAREIVGVLGIRDPQPTGPFYTDHKLVGSGKFQAIALSGYEYGLLLQTFPGEVENFQWDDVQGEIGLSNSGENLVIRKEDQLLMEMPLVEILLELSQSRKYNKDRRVTPIADLTFDYENDDLRVRLIIHSVEFQQGAQLPLVQRLKGLILLSDTLDLVPGQQ